MHSKICKLRCNKVDVMSEGEDESDDDEEEMVIDDVEEEGKKDEINATAEKGEVEEETKVEEKLEKAEQEGTDEDIRAVLRNFQCDRSTAFPSPREQVAKQTSLPVLSEDQVLVTKPKPIVVDPRLVRAEQREKWISPGTRQGPQTSSFKDLLLKLEAIEEGE